MVDSPLEDSNNKLAVAQEVIVSAGNILAAAGFQREEIAGFFRQAADQLAFVPSPAPLTMPSTPPIADVPPPRSVAEMMTRFADIPPVRALMDMAVDVQVVAGLRDGSQPARAHIELALQMLPQVAEAQNWLRDTAREAGLDVVANRRQWLAEAAPEDLAQAERMLFLDDFEPAYKPCFDFVTALAAAVVCENDEDSLNVMLQGLVSCGVIVTYDLKLELEAGVEKLIPMSIDAV